MYSLSFCVTTDKFYDTVHELTFPTTRLMSEQAVALGVELSDEDWLGDHFVHLPPSDASLKARIFLLLYIIYAEKK